MTVRDRSAQGFQRGGNRVDRPSGAHNVAQRKRNDKKKSKPENKNTAHENSANKTNKIKQSPSQNPLGKKKMIMSTVPLYATCPFLFVRDNKT